jgi:hypothetical protein
MYESDLGSDGNLKVLLEKKILEYAIAWEGNGNSGSDFEF